MMLFYRSCAMNRERSRYTIRSLCGVSGTRRYSACMLLTSANKARMLTAKPYTDRSSLHISLTPTHKANLWSVFPVTFNTVKPVLSGH